MKDNELDDLLREKANNIDDSKFNFKMDVNEIKKQAEAKKKNNILRISFASVLAACLILGLLFFVSRTTKNIEDNVILQGNEENETKDIQVSYHGKYTTSVYNGEYSYTDGIPENVFIVRVNSINNLGIVEGVPKISVIADVIESYKGEKKDDFVFTADECMVNTSDIDKYKDKIVDNIDISMEYIRLVVYETMLKTPYPEIGKTYIVSLDKDFKVINRCVYPFYEYDPETKKVKIGEEWQDIDFNYIVW